MKRTLCKVSMTQPQLDEFFRKLRERQDAAERCELVLLRGSAKPSTINDAVRVCFNGHAMTTDSVFKIARLLVPDLTKQQVRNSVAYLRDKGVVKDVGSVDGRSSFWAKV